MHLTPLERMQIVYIYNSLDSQRTTNKAKTTSNIAAQKDIFISPRSVMAIISKWSKTSNFNFSNNKKKSNIF